RPCANPFFEWPPDTVQTPQVRTARPFRRVHARNKCQRRPDERRRTSILREPRSLLETACRPNIRTRRRLSACTRRLTVRPRFCCRPVHGPARRAAAAPARRSRCWRTTVSTHRQTRLQAPGLRPCSVCRSSAMLENFPYTLRLLPPRAMPPLMKQFTARRRLRRSTLFPGSGQAVGSDFQEPPETPAAVV